MAGTFTGSFHFPGCGTPPKEKPLHALVSEALGFGPFIWSPEDSWFRPFCMDAASGWPLRYDTDWLATGPLIERLRLELQAPGHNGGPDLWSASYHYREPFMGKGPGAGYQYGSTPLVAVCNLILALKAAGRLET